MATAKLVRLRHTTTGAVVQVREDKVLGSEWAPVVSGEQSDGDGAPKGNASRDEWASYADSIGVEYDADAKRDDIKAAVDAAAK